MPDLLLELFSEEIPARMQARAADELSALIGAALKAEGLTYDKLVHHVTPRRLAVIVTGLPVGQEDRTVEKRGPKVGAPEQALQGFLRSAGLSKDQLIERESGKDSYYFAVIQEKGKQTADCLKPLIETALAKLSWPKSMRWGDTPLRWVRPLHSILCLFDDAIIPVEFGHITAGNSTRGHRFMAPGTIKLGSAEAYQPALEKASVMLDREARKQTIADGLAKSGEGKGFTVKDDAALLEEVTGLVEWPVVLTGSIEGQFMHLPPEVLSTAMRSHQKYFSTETAEGELAPHFVFVANIETKDAGKAIIHGNERVLRARLSDAAFFWEQDRKTLLQDRVPQLDHVIFHASLGTLADKARRMEALAKFLAVWVPHAGLNDVARAAKLCKADLVSEMVGEFPELQGLMGRYYALDQGEPAAVADALRDHYAPQGPNDDVPEAPVSMAIALADKMDSLAGLFAADERPTGSKDPFALRRAALGVIRLIRANHLSIPLNLLIDKAISFYPPAMFKTEDKEGRKGKERREAVQAGLLEFMAERLKVALKDEGYRHDTITSIFDGGEEDDFERLVARVDALQQFLATENGGNLLTAYKRAANILKAEEAKDNTTYDARVDKMLLSAPEEKALLEQLIQTRKALKPLLKKDAFAEAMAALASLRGPVDAFFEHVTVNAPDPSLRRNRLLLLGLLRSSMDRIADFGVIEG